MKFAIIVRYEFDLSWLRLSREERTAHREVFEKEVVGPFTDRLSVRHFDAEAFSTAYSDFLLIETDDLTAYYFFIEKLRQRPHRPRLGAPARHHHRHPGRLQGVRK